jgi:tRNA dimethylallyltransferase
LTDTVSICINTPVLALIGPTAVGKTDLSIKLAQAFKCEIVSVDSMQVYRYMDIGTAKASKEEQRLVAHHLIDIVDPDEDYHAGRFVKDCLDAIDTINRRGAVPLLTGGTGLYLHSLKHGLFSAPEADPEIREGVRRRMVEEGSQALHEELRGFDPRSAERIHPHDQSRISRALEVYLYTGKTQTEWLKKQEESGKSVKFTQFITVGITCERDELYRRINQRTALLFEYGLEDEVRDLLGRGYAPELKSMQSIGYRHMIQYIAGNWSFERCRELLARDTRRYAKRQYTWFNRDPSISWFDREEHSALFSHIDTMLSQNRT